MGKVLQWRCMRLHLCPLVLLLHHKSGWNSIISKATYEAESASPWHPAPWPNILFDVAFVHFKHVSLGLNVQLLTPSPLHVLLKCILAIVLSSLKKNWKRNFLCAVCFDQTQPGKYTDLLLRSLREMLNHQHANVVQEDRLIANHVKSIHQGEVIDYWRLCLWTGCTFAFEWARQTTGSVGTYKY